MYEELAFGDLVSWAPSVDICNMGDDTYTLPILTALWVSVTLAHVKVLREHWQCYVIMKENLDKCNTINS